jgi:protein arginine N-methyltransferase 1
MAYDLFSYNQMMSDDIRRNAHNLAARAAIRPGSVVAEIGTGNGYYAILACRLGARKVYAIEPHPIIGMAQQLAQANGCADRIEFIQDMSIHVSLPEQVDVVYCDLRGASPLYGANIQSVIDARTRFLLPGGTLVPERDDLFGAFVSSEALYQDYCDPIPQLPDEPDLSLTRSLLRNLIVRENTVQAHECVSGPLHLATIDYRTVESPSVRGAINWTAAEATTIHGVTIWFDAHLIGDVSFSTSPFGPKTIYSRIFLAFAAPIELEAGDSAGFSFEAFLIGNNYQWRWNTVVTEESSRDIKVMFEQSSLESSFHSMETALRRHHQFVPPATANRELLSFVLGRIDGVRSLETISRELASQFPERFADWNQALVFVVHAVEQAR